MARMKWTRESALEYLSHRKLLTKPASEYKTPQLKRLAGSARQQELAGQEFDRDLAYGRKGKNKKARKEGKKQPPTAGPKQRRIIAPIEFYPADRKKHDLKQWRVMRPRFKKKTPTQLQDMSRETFIELWRTGRELDHGDITRLYLATPEDKAKIYLGIWGIGEDSKNRSGEFVGEEEPDPEKIHTYAFPITREQIKTWLQEAPENDADDIFSFAQDFSGVKWSFVFGIIFAYPESW